MERVDLVQVHYVDSDEYRGVLAIADALHEFLVVAEVSAQILSDDAARRLTGQADVEVAARPITGR